jgi:hypothetical protein
MRVFLLFFVFSLSLFVFSTSATANEATSFAWCGGEAGLNSSYTRIEWQNDRDDSQSTLVYSICSAQRHDIMPLQYLSFEAPSLNIRWTYRICEERIDCVKSAKVLQPDGSGYCLRGFMKLNYPFYGDVAATVTLYDTSSAQVAAFCVHA